MHKYTNRAITFCFCLFFTFTVQAAARVLHRTYVIFKDHRSQNVHVLVEFGYGSHKLCVVPVREDLGKITVYPVGHFWELKSDLAALQHHLSFQCAVATFTPDKGHVKREWFNLVTKNKNYIGSDPFYSKVTLD